MGGNVRLLTNLWPDAAISKQGDRVYAWPKGLQHKCPPLVLRLIRVVNGASCVYLLTNVLDAKRLSKKAAGKIYRLRWGAELFYRAFKRTLGFVKLKSKSSRRAQVELEWGLVSCCITTLLGINAMGRRRVDPRRISAAGLWRVLRKSLRHGRPGRDAGLRLQALVALRRRWLPATRPQGIASSATHEKHAQTSPAQAAADPRRDRKRKENRP